MLHESTKKNELKIINNHLSFEDFYAKKYFPQELESNVKKANFLIIPFENFGDLNRPVFPEETRNFFIFMKTYSPELLVTEICISDDEYTELELHSDLLILPMFILNAIVLPIAINILSDYIKLKIQSKNRNTDTKIKLNFTVVNENKSTTIQYEGDAEKFSETFEPIKDYFVNNEDIQK